MDKMALRIKQMTRDAKLTQRTLNILKKKGRILLKRNIQYLGCWTNLASGPDSARWSDRRGALEMFNLKWAFTFAKLYNCKVVVAYPNNSFR